MTFTFDISEEKLQGMIEREVASQLINQVCKERYTYEKKMIKEAVSAGVRKALEENGAIEKHLEDKIVDKAADILAKKGLAKLLKNETD